jgi:hypothetical protein
VGRDGGGADIDCNAKGLVVKARPDGDEAIARVARINGAGDFPFPFAQHFLQFLENVEFTTDILDAPLGFQCCVDALQV